MDATGGARIQISANQIFLHFSKDLAPDMMDRRQIARYVRDLKEPNGIPNGFV